MRPLNQFKINIGSYTVMFDGWMNLDIINAPELYVYAFQNNKQFLSVDASRGLPFGSGTADFIFSSHMIEHVSYRVAENLLKECYRVMKPGAVMRIAVPDLELLVNMYKENRLSELNRINEPCKYAKYDTERFWMLLTTEHRACYDWLSMKQMCEGAGFSVKRYSYNVGNETIIRETKDLFPEVSLYVECTK